MLMFIVVQAKQIDNIFTDNIFTDNIFTDRFNINFQISRLFYSFYFLFSDFFCTSNFAFMRGELAKFASVQHSLEETLVGTLYTTV